MKKYDYLLWDIDGTVLDFAAAERAAIRKLFEQFRMGPCTDDMLQRYSAINARYWQALERGEMTKPEILVGRFREFFASEGLDAGLAEAFNACYQPTLGDTIVFRDDAMTILQALKKDYRILFVTNGTAEAQQKKLRLSGLETLADGIYISDLIGYEKPSLRFFEAVMRDSGMTDPRRALIIGDSLTSDIRGGVNAGMDTCWYNPRGAANSTDLKPDHVISDLHQVWDIL